MIWTKRFCQSSPYIHPFIEILQSRGHVVSVVLPHQQRSWIGKAHFVGELIKPTYFRPGSIHQDDGKTSDRPSSANLGENEWVLVNSTPATCAQLGLFHFFQDRGPVDVVVSGPNYGRNSTALFSLSSGTIGGAMEAALFRKRAIALSFAFDSSHHKPDLIAGACRQAVKIIEHLCQNWAPEADLYNINVPLVAGVEDRKILFTYSLQNYWSPTASLFEEVEAMDGDLNPEIQEMEIRQSGEIGGKASLPKTVHRHRHFKFAPRFSDVSESVDQSSEGNDGWAIKQGFTRSVSLYVDLPFI